MKNEIKKEKTELEVFKNEVTKCLNTLIHWSVLCSISNAKKDFKDFGLMIMMFMVIHDLKINDDHVPKISKKEEG